VSNLAVPGIFFAASVDICSLLLLIILLLLPRALPTEMGWKASERETVASSAVNIALVSNIILGAEIVVVVVATVYGFEVCQIRV
jgi:hypothetical protein